MAYSEPSGRMVRRNWTEKDFSTFADLWSASKSLYDLPDDDHFRRGINTPRHIGKWPVVQMQFMKCHDNDPTGADSSSRRSQAHTVHNKRGERAQFTMNLHILQIKVFVKCSQSTWRVPKCNDDSPLSKEKKSTHSPSETPGRLSQSGPAVRTADWVVSCSASAFAAISLSQDLATVATDPTSHCEFLFFLTLYLLKGERGFFISF